MSRHRQSLIILMAVLWLAVPALVAGCAGNGPGGAAPPTGGTASGVTGAPTPTETPTAATGAPTGGSSPASPAGPSPSPSVSPPAGQLTLHGTVFAGAEPSCLLVNHAGVSYLLLGGDPAIIRDGATVTVQGSVARGIMSHCMQGVPFRVSQARTG